MTGVGDTAVDLADARRLVTAERTRIESALADLDGAVRAEGDLQSQQAGDTAESGTEIAAEVVAMAVGDGLRGRLLEADRAAKRIEDGTYSLSVESGVRIPPDRLAADPLAERTVDEQAALDRRSGVTPS
jgi:DnaK suppressor protein